MARVRRTGLRLALATGAVAVAVPLLFEVVYRFQLADTYRAELEAYNPAELLTESSNRPTLLAMGDSLTAGTTSYPSLLRARLPDWRVVNAGVPATGAVQARLIAPARFERFAPSALVYEINLSNDLLNQRFPVAWGELSFARNLYWSVSERLRGIEYLNYRAAQIAFGIRARKYREVAPVRVDPASSCEHASGAFDPDLYTERDRLYLRAEPGLIENQVSLRGGRAEDFEAWSDDLAAVLEHCVAPRCKPTLLVVPHASQVARSYLEEVRALGARFDAPLEFERPDYGFLVALRRELARRGLTHVAVLDALPALREAESRGVRTYFRYDAHLNACGQEVLAELIMNLSPFL